MASGKRSKHEEHDENLGRDPSGFLLKAYESFVPDIVRKTVLLGLGSVAMTEEGVRRALADLRLPREEARRLLDYILEQSQRTKTEVVALVGSEVKSFLRTLSLEEELRRALSGMRVRIEADITFEQIEGGGPRLELKIRDKSTPAADLGAEPPEPG
jgi:polyhydroxyalkanoate synthesis regulator phasin